MADDFTIETKFSVLDYAVVTRRAVTKMAQQLQVKEREDIAAAGMQRFAPRSNARVTGKDGNYTVYVNLRPGWMKAFELGAISLPKRRQKTEGPRLLWIPVPGGPRMRARAYRRVRGHLYRPKGKNVLIDMATRKVAYVGIPMQTIKPVLHIRQITDEMAAYFVRNVQEYTSDA